MYALNVLQDVPIVVADSANQDSVDTMVSQADMLIACAGPFSKYTAPVVDASVRLKTNYCDITGKIQIQPELFSVYCHEFTHLMYVHLAT